MFILLFSLAILQLPAQNVNTIEQSVAGRMDVPGNPALSKGLAGFFAGIHNDVMIIAGGSNFPGKELWEGASRVLYDRILVASQNPDGSVSVLETNETLPFPLADGASLSVPSGVLCIGGQTVTGLSRKVFLLRWNGREVETDTLPPLPLPLKGHKAAMAGNRVYVAGGESPLGPSSAVMSIDLGVPSGAWTSLPAMPVPLKDFIFEVQTDGEFPALYVIGGRMKEQDEILTGFYSSVFRFRTRQNIWERRRDIHIPGKGEMALAAAASVTSGSSYIILFGGDTGTVFSQVEEAIHRAGSGNGVMASVRDSLWRTHPGFNDDILAYNTITDAWYVAGKWEGRAPAVTSALWWNDRIVIPGGETGPGIRNPEIIAFNMGHRPGFGWVNYMVLVVYMAGMLGVGFYFMKRGRNADDFFKAGGRIPWWAAGISIFATTLSAITFLAIPAKSYATDWRMLVFNLCIILTVPVIIRYYLPFFRRFNLDTAYEYLELRFSRAVRMAASGLFILFMISRIAIVLFLPSLALHAVTGFSVYWSVILMGVITIIYCTSGGIEAVVWGDVIQGFILVSGAVIAFAFMISGVHGGIGEFAGVTSEYRKFNMVDLSLDFSQPVLWVVVIGGIANSLILYTSDQSVVQRYMTTRDERATARSLWLNGILSIPVSLVFFLLGTGLFAFYHFNPERLVLTNPNIDATFPQFIVGELPAGMAGVLISAIFAAAMSTLSSNINSVSAVITADFYRLLVPGAGNSNIMLSARISGVVAGITGILMALMLATWDIASLWDQFNTFLGLLTGGLGALFIMGIFFRHISAPAALAGLVTGMTVLVWIQMHTTLSFLLYGAAGILISLFSAILISLVVPNKKNIRGYTYMTRKTRVQ